MKLGTILVSLDGSALAEAALLKALELAEVSGARVLLLRAAHAQARPGVDDPTRVPGLGGSGRLPRPSPGSA